MENIKISKLEIENTKRVKAVKIEPTNEGLTVIGGKNAQGKTSVLDAIAWALGGDRYKPSIPKREGSTIPPHLSITLNNGLVVERKGKNSDLKVIDPEGNKGGQQLLNSFVEQLALDLPKFMESSDKEKANILLKIIGVGDKVYELEQKEEELFNKRHALGQIADQKKKFADEQEYFIDAPKELVSANELIQRQQEILIRNGENQKKRQNLEYIESNHNNLLTQQAELLEKIEQSEKDLETARKSALDLHDESTEELEKSIQEVDETNRKVRINLDKDKAETDAQDYKDQYDALTVQIEDIRKKKTDLLVTADLPLEGLSVDKGCLLYNGQKWDNMSASEQLRISTAIIRKLNPSCGFVLLDKLEQMDIDTMNEFGQWLEKEGLQAIATRVSTGDECSIIIEDGYVKGNVDNITQPVMEKEEEW